MAATPDAVGTIGFGASVLAANSVSSTITVGSSSNRLGIVTVMWNSTATVDVCTFDGADILANNIGKADQTTSGFHVQHFFVVNPASGAGKVASASLTSNTGVVYVIAHTYSDADQTTPTDGFVATQGDASQPASSPVTSAVGDLVVDAIAMQSMTTSTGSGTQLWQDLTSSGTMDSQGQRTAGAASVSPGYTTDPARNWCIAAFNINAAAAGLSVMGRTVLDYDW